MPGEPGADDVCMEQQVILSMLILFFGVLTIR